MDVENCIHHEERNFLLQDSSAYLMEHEDIEILSSSSSTGSSEEEEEEHPLVSSTVASLVLSYLPFEDLKSCRLICRAWDEEARIHLSRKVKVVLHSENRLKNYATEFIVDRGFFDTIQLGPYLYMGNADMDRFFELYGVFIKHLILHKTQCSAVHLREILFRWAPNVEELTLVGMTPGKSRFLDDLHVYDKLNLNNLKIVNLNLMLTQGEEVLRDFLFDLFSVSPNLEKIAVPKHSYKGFLTCLIATLLESPDLPLDNLAQVNALLSFGDGQIEQLTSRRFPLESLNMQLMPNVTIDVLLALLDSLSNTLRSLRLYFYLTRFKELPTPVRMERVEKITLDTYQGSLRFISHLPELKELRVVMKCLEELVDAFPTAHHGPTFWCCPSLRSFTASLSVVEGCPSRLIASFESVFPGLRSINLPGITDIALKLLCLTYPKLEELTAPHGVYTDMGVTGIAEGKLRFLSRSTDSNDLRSIKESLDTPFVGSLRSLTCLSKLRLQSADVTDDSIFFAILHLRNLKELSIERSDITDRGIDAITNHMDLQRLSITLCTRVSGPQLEVVKAKMRNRNLVLNFDGKRYSMYD